MIAKIVAAPFSRDRVLHGLVELDGGHGRDARIGPAVVENRLAAPLHEGGHVGIVRPGHTRIPGRVRRQHVGRIVDVEIAYQVQTGVLKPCAGDHVAAPRGLRIVAVGAEKSLPALPAVAFATREASRVNPFAGFGDGSFVDLADKIELTLAQAHGRCLGSAALQHSGIEAALARIVDDAIHDSIVRIAGCQRALMDEINLCRGQGLTLLRKAGVLLRHPDLGHVQAGQRKHGSAGDDTVEIPGIALHGLESLASAGRTAKVIGVLRPVRVVGIHQLLANLGGEVNGSVPEILDGDAVGHDVAVPGGMHHPVFRSVPGMAGVGLPRGETQLQGDLCTVLSLEHARRAAVAEDQEPTIPVRLVRQAKPKPDTAAAIVGIGDFAFKLTVGDTFAGPFSARERDAMGRISGGLLEYGQLACERSGGEQGKQTR